MSDSVFLSNYYNLEYAKRYVSKYSRPCLVYQKDLHRAHWYNLYLLSPLDAHLTLIDRYNFTLRYSNFLDYKCSSRNYSFNEKRLLDTLSLFNLEIFISDETYNN